MEKTPEGVYEKNEKKIKELLLIFNLVMTTAKNIDEFETSEIILTEKIKKESLKNFVLTYKNTKCQTPTNLNIITFSFINLISNILSHYYIQKVSHIQLLMAYNLFYIFHKGASKEKIEEYKKDFNLLSYIVIQNYHYYVDILRMIKLIEKEEEKDVCIQFLNKCQIIKNLNKSELYANISTFLLKNDEIPQYKNIDLKLDLNDDEITFNNKIEEIANLFDVINASLNINTGNMRFKLYNRYINQDNSKLKAINQVLSSLKIKNIFSLNENNLFTKIELYRENCHFLQKENNKRNMSIGGLMKKIVEYEKEVNTLNQKIEVLSNNLKTTKYELYEEEIKTENLNMELENQINKLMSCSKSYKT